MKHLIVYYSFTGNNEFLAKYLQGRLHCDMLRLEEVEKRTGLTILLDLVFHRKPRLKPYHVRVKDYDRLILLAPVWDYQIATPLKSFLIQEGQNIGRYAFLSICSGRPEQKDKLLHEMAQLVGREADQVMELWVKDLLPKEKQKHVKYTSGYRIGQQDLAFFKNKIDEFLKSLKGGVYQA